MAGVVVLVRVWKEWGIQVLVLLSFALQVTLLTLAEVRRLKDSGVLRVVVWSAYLLADSTAIYALGHLSVTSRLAEHQLMAFWAPFLLLHLGGQDNITAYAIEDNRLWLRHLQALSIQVAAAAYVLYESSIWGSHALLWRAAILMFVVGVLKYGERVWALKCANASGKQTKVNYRYCRKDLYGDVLDEPIKPQDTEDLLRTAHLLLNVPKNFLERPIGKGRMRDYTWPGAEARKKLFTLVEMQLSLMHDVLYSKAEVMHTWYGLCVRIISSVFTAAAFVLFHRCDQADHSSRADVAVTYVLLVGAIVLETTSLLRAIFSSWIVADMKLLSPVVSRVRRLVLWERKKWWSESMGQHNLFELLDRRRTSRSSRITRWLGMEDWWNTTAHSRRVPVWPKMKQLLVDQLCTLHDSPLLCDEIKMDRNLGLWEMKLDESIVVWHIATNVYLGWYKDHHQKQPEDQTKEEEQPEDQTKEQWDLVEFIEALSNYMLFLLVARPYMLPDNPSRRSYVQLCYDLGVRSDVSISSEDFLRSLQGKGRGLHGLDQQVDNETLQRASQIVKTLMDEGLVKTCRALRYSIDSDGDEFGTGDGNLKQIALVWTHMVIDAGRRCGAYAHAKQLSNGGELLTVATFVGEHAEANFDRFLLEIKR